MEKRVFAFVLPFCLASLSAQSGYIPPNPVSPPAMQKISPPTVTPPSAPTMPAVSAAQQSAGGASESSSASADETTKKNSMSALSLLGLDTDNALLGALAGTGTGDASVSALSSLLGLDSATSGTSALASTSVAGASSKDSETLKKILELLEKQAAGSGKSGAATAASGTPAASSAGAAGALTSGASGAGPALQQSGAELVRFSVNGYSILGSITVLVSSIRAADGSFLLTGDRLFSASGVQLAETFYLLCRPGKNGSWQLTADVSQNPVNHNSFLYQLAGRSPVSGLQTADLIVFRSDSDEWRLDLVIRAPNATVE